MRVAKLVVLLAGIAVIAVGSVVLAAETKSKPAAAAKSKPASTTKKTAKPAAATKSAKSAKSTKTAKAVPATKGAPKTLEEITIEGEVKLPEVLFITSRDVERPLDWLDGYLSAETGAAARADDAPVAVHVVPASPGDSAAVGAPVSNQVTVNPAPESAP